MPMPNKKPEQDLMNDGPGLKQRNRETAAVSTAVMPASGATSGTVAKPASPPTSVDKVNRGKFGSKPGEKSVSEMKALGVLHKGTDYVPKTGNYTLQKGEAVVSKEKNKMNPYAKITEGDKKPKKEIKRIITHKSHDGKLIHTHEHHHPEHHENETHVSSNMAEMHDHMEKHAGMPNEGETPADGDTQMAQLTASPSPMPAGGAPVAQGSPTGV